MAHAPLHFDSDRLDTLLFNPIDETQFNHSSSDLDPNVNFSMSSTTSNFAVQDEVNATFESKQDNLGFSLMHISARSLLSSFDSIKSLLANSYLPFSAIGISETWLMKLQQIKKILRVTIFYQLIEMVWWRCWTIFA